ncbi:uncharacterized protein CTHT_0001140 [Thermochaetoides thermophila DSM 1495]|uniref:Uncharacterized protein n=1 Tax=Chaetomium thermophilum (strain DSM 1495 / CBS 144.50 / IMI 039719) TaxID=759272 RepID=G0RYZ7_CHATD|nr:hypothetical protein CTHT_0001140 [Thermochaetoides thermophila DSM 1495]EGS23425.1 hypothetical protein CTHT_0001140 [Thermochaetoides thermophila DSM 1495]
MGWQPADSLGHVALLRLSIPSTILECQYSAPATTDQIYDSNIKKENTILTKLGDVLHQQELLCCDLDVAAEETESLVDGELTN